MWSGLCRGMTRTVLGTLLNGRPLEGKTVLIGGVALNQEVVRWLKHDCPGLIDVPEQPALVAAYRRRALGEAGAETACALAPRREAAGPNGNGRFPWPLTLEKSTHPSFATAAELRGRRRQRGARHRAGAEGDTVRGLPRHRHRLDQHQGHPRSTRRATSSPTSTARRPAIPSRATKLLFRALRTLAADKGARARDPGRGHHRQRPQDRRPGHRRRRHRQRDHRARGRAPRTSTRRSTPSSRSAGRTPSTCTCVDGHIRDANMNYVCAAGTGSFVEEQAQQARLQGRRGRAGGAGPAAAARHGPLHGLHGAGRRPAHPHRAPRRRRRWPR